MGAECMILRRAQGVLAFRTSLRIWPACSPNAPSSEFIWRCFSLSGGPSFFFDTVFLLVSEATVGELVEEAAAVAWVMDAFGLLKVIGYVPTASLRPCSMRHPWRRTMASARFPIARASPLT